MFIKGRSGNIADVNELGEVLFSGIAQTPIERANENGDAYSVLVDVTSATADDDFFYLKNKDSRDMVIYKIEGWCDDANQEIKVLIGATDAGTDAGDDLTPVNANTKSGNDADVDCTQDATDLAVTGGSVVSLLKFSTTALELGTFDFSSGIILGENRRLHMEALLAGLINLNVYFYFKD